MSQISLERSEIGFFFGCKLPLGERALALVMYWLLGNHGVAEIRFLVLRIVYPSRGLGDSSGLMLRLTN